MASRHGILKSTIAKVILLCATSAGAQMLPNPYGSPISVEAAKKAAELSLTEARKNNWKMAVAVVDPAGVLIYYEKMDNTQLGSADAAIDKARSAALYKRPTRHFRTRWRPVARGCGCLGCVAQTRWRAVCRC